MHNSQAKKQFWVSIPLVMCWLAGTVYAFWWFQVRDLRPFDGAGQAQAAVFEGALLAEKLHSLPLGETNIIPVTTGNPQQALVVHFWNPGCACNKFNNPHVRDIVEQYHSRGIRFVTVVKSQAGQDEQALLARAQEMFNAPAMMDSNLQLEPASAPAATPAAAVVNSQGQLAYFGPYSDSAFCGANGSSFVEKTLDKVLEGKATESLNTLAFGCFCQWKADTSV